jgi:hypothetical protein
MPPWWLGLYPGLAMSITLLAFNLFGDGLHDALNHFSNGSKGASLMPAVASDRARVKI